MVPLADLEHPADPDYSEPGDHSEVDYQIFVDAAVPRPIGLDIYDWSHAAAVAFSGL